MKAVYTFIAIVIAAMLTGCTKYEPSVNTVANAETTAKIKRIEDKRVDTDPQLAQSLALTEVRESQTNDGYKRIQVFLKNFTGTTYSVLYRFNWYDNNGVEVENPDNEMWKRTIITAGDDLTLTSVAPAQNCKDFKLRLKATN